MVRIKHRYLLVHILYPSSSNNPSQSKPPPDLIQFHRPTPDDITPQVLVRAIREHLGALYGDYGVGTAGSAGLTVKYLSPSTSTFIVRCPRARYQLVWAALTFMTCLPRATDKAGASVRGGNATKAVWEERECVMRVVRVSGTIRKSEEEVIRRARGDILRARREGKGEGQGLLEGLLGGQKIERVVEGITDVAGTEDGSEEESEGEEG